MDPNEPNHGGWFMDVYPLVNVYITHNYGKSPFFEWVNQLFRLGHVSIVMCVYQRVPQHGFNCSIIISIHQCRPDVYPNFRSWLRRLPKRSLTQAAHEEKGKKCTRKIMRNMRINWFYILMVLLPYGLMVSVIWLARFDLVFFFFHGLCLVLIIPLSGDLPEKTSWFSRFSWFRGFRVFVVFVVFFVLSMCFCAFVLRRFSRTFSTHQYKQVDLPWYWEW